MKEERFIRRVVVTTERKGVFFGELIEFDNDKPLCILKNAKMCIYWSEETHGVLGLAATGPMKGSRITPSIPLLEIPDKITAIMDCTEQAIAKWSGEIWD